MKKLACVRRLSLVVLLTSACCLTSCHKRGRGDDRLHGMLRDRNGTPTPKIVRFESAPLEIEHVNFATTGGTLATDWELADEDGTERNVEFKFYRLNHHKIVSQGAANPTDCITNSSGEFKTELPTVQVSGANPTRVTITALAPGNLKSGAIYLLVGRLQGQASDDRAGVFFFQID